MGIDIHDVAEYYLSKTDCESGDNLTHLKLQKHSYSLLLLGTTKDEKYTSEFNCNIRSLS